MGAERIVIEGAEIVEAVMPGIGERLLADASKAMPAFGRMFRKEAVAAVQHLPITPAGSGLRAEASALSRMPRVMTPAEEDEHLERLMRAIDDPVLGLPPKELTNQGLGARLWQFGTGGGDVFRERAVAETTGRWPPELARSREWLSKNAQSFSRVLPLPEGTARGAVQMVHQGESTQFAAGPIGVGLRTDNVATCAAVHCTDGARQFLGHADGMIHHLALTEALSTAGIDLSKAKVTLLPGPLNSPVLETIMPTFLENPNALKGLRIIPFRGPGNGRVIAQDGTLFMPK